MLPLHKLHIGYRRVLTVEQKFDRLDLGADIERVFQEQESGGTAERKALQEMIAFARLGDELPMTITGKPQKFIMRDEMIKALSSESSLTWFTKWF